MRQNLRRWLHKVAVLLTVILCVCLFSLGALAETWVLFENGVKVEHYSKIVANIQVGDRLVFSGGRQFDVLKILGKGSSQKILAISDELAIRISIAGFPEVYPGRLYLNEIDRLRNFGVKIGDVFEDLSNPKEFIVVRRYDHAEQETVESFMRNIANYSSDQIQERMSALVEFSESTAYFESIADFWPRNVFWTGAGEWRLIDFDGYHHLVKLRSDLSQRDAFSNWNNFDLPDNVLDQIHRRISQVRLGLSCEWPLIKPQ